MNPTRAIRFSLFGTLFFTLGVAATAQQCNRPAPPGQYANAQAVQRHTPLRADDQQTINEMARGTYGSASGSPGMKEKMAAERREALQQKVTSQSAKLLTLAQKLNADAVASNKDQLSVAVVKEASEIEKLAKSIQGKISHGY
jgi:hypothetical protein